jgi:HNH endonuclease
MHIEHIDPAGGDSIDNLCLSCPNCNLSKAAASYAPDPLTGQIVQLFNPRVQVWSEHFVWLENGIRIEGLTPVGRATIERLKMNQDGFLIARARWIESGYHPPELPPNA